MARLHALGERIRTSYGNPLPYTAPERQGDCYTIRHREADSAEDLRALTNGFLRVRYGNYTATRAFYDGMCRFRDALVRRLLHTEGGEP